MPFQVAIQRGVRVYHDQTTRPLNDIRWELFTLLAHGAFVTMVDKMGYDGWLDPVAYERIGAALPRRGPSASISVSRPCTKWGFSTTPARGIGLAARQTRELVREFPRRTRKRASTNT